MCPQYTLDFNKFVAGNYLNKQLEEEYGVEIIAVGQTGSGYAPDNAARVMDTGVDGMGNALIIQESDVIDTVWNENGGSITFSFVDGAHLEEINILHSMSSQDHVDVTLSFCTGETEELESTDRVSAGEGNWLSAYSLVNNERYVSGLTVKGLHGFAVTELKYMLCPGTCSSSTPSLAPSPIPSIMKGTSESPTSEIVCLPGMECGPGHVESFEPTGAPVFAATESPVSTSSSGPTDSFICADDPWMSGKDYDDEDEF